MLEIYLCKTEHVVLELVISSREGIGNFSSLDFSSVDFQEGWEVLQNNTERANTNNSDNKEKEIKSKYNSLKF